MPWMDSALILGKFCQVSPPINVENLTKFSICLEEKKIPNFQYDKFEEEGKKKICWLALEVRRRLS